MRVLIINTSERIGGAAIAAHRLMEALKNNGIKAKMLVRDKQTDQILSLIHIYLYLILTAKIAIAAGLYIIIMQLSKSATFKEVINYLSKKK